MFRRVGRSRLGDCLTDDEGLFRVKLLWRCADSPRAFPISKFRIGHRITRM
jgi:hypothetical protein